MFDKWLMGVCLRLVLTEGDATTNVDKSHWPTNEQNGYCIYII